MQVNVVLHGGSGKRRHAVTVMLPGGCIVSSTEMANWEMDLTSQWKLFFFWGGDKDSSCNTVFLCSFWDMVGSSENYPLPYSAVSALEENVIMLQICILPRTLMLSEFIR